MPTTTCPQCDRPLDVHDRHIRFSLPQPVLDAGRQEDEAGIWMSHEDANTSVMMGVTDLGAYVRCLLPVRLTGGFTVTFGVWLEVSTEDLHRAFAAWWAPEYRDLVLGGRLANPIRVWGMLGGAPVEARVHDEDQTPYLDHSADPVLNRVLTEQWSHETILDALPS